MHYINTITQSQMAAQSKIPGPSHEIAKVALHDALQIN